MAQQIYLATYIGDGAYAYVTEYRSLVFYTSNGIAETNRVEIDVGDIDTFMRWLEEAVKLAKSRADEAS